MPSSVAGTLIITLGRPTAFHSRLPSAIDDTRLLGKIRRQLDRHVAVPAVACSIQIREDVARFPNILDRDDVVHLSGRRSRRGPRVL